MEENTPDPIAQTRGVDFNNRASYNSTDSTSATNLATSSPRHEATTWNMASLKPPMFRMSSRSGACVEPYGWMLMQTSLGELTPIRCWFATNVCTRTARPLHAGDRKPTLG